MLKIFMGIVVVVLVALSAGGAYYLGSIKTEEKLKTEAAAIAGDPAPSEWPTPWMNIWTSTTSRQAWN